jgi:hypothetical protein
MTYGAGDFDRVAPGPTSFIPLCHVLTTSSDGSIIMSLTAPTVVGGTQSRLGSVEWCLYQDAINNAFVSTAAVYYDQPGTSSLAIAVNDPTDRSAAGCYTLTVPALSVRAYSLALGLSGNPQSTSNSVVFRAVRATWVPVS